MSLTYSSPLTALTGVGPTAALRLKKLGLKQVKDLLFYFPERYEDFSKIYPLNMLPSEGHVTIKAKVELIRSRRSWHRRMQITEALVNDDTGSLKLIWFNQPYIAEQLKPGEEIFFSGNIKNTKLGSVLANPLFEKRLTDNLHTARIIPLYALTAGITEKQLRWWIKQSLPLITRLPDWLPEELLVENKLIPLKEALTQIHYPDSWTSLNLAQIRLRFNELFLIQLYVQKNKAELTQQAAPCLAFKEVEIKDFVASLPFILTTDQKKVTWQILKDLAKPLPMQRLLEGDVGSGKTVVAAIALLNTALNGYQALFMAPTEILAEQHYKTLKTLLPTQKISLLTHSKKIIAEGGEIFVGTHALLQKNISFNNLGLAIIDEQHRFGVLQRKALREKNGPKKLLPHLLSMTATPIPRSLALTVYGDLALSLLKEKPKSRKTIITRLVAEEKRVAAYQFIREKIKAGGQMFVICPLIAESDKLGVKSVEKETQFLTQEIFPEFTIAKIHGKLKPQEKSKIMADFQAKKIQILVSTSVIEVGVDIPAANIIMIEGSERFGLAQLHQFRGRVGRSGQQAYCLLFTNSAQDKTRARLNALVKCADGFQLAEIDLASRGPGAFFGTLQSGYLETIKLTNLNDQLLITKAQEAAKNIFPLLDKYPLLNKKIQQFALQIHLE